MIEKIKEDNVNIIVKINEIIDVVNRLEEQHKINVQCASECQHMWEKDLESTGNGFVCKKCGIKKQCSIEMVGN
jgi:hypothetical protein